MSKYQTGNKNGMWKGGRSIASNGYVLIRVDPSHHLADVRGYAYEHRLVAEEKLGRKLVEGEIVHHKNEDKTDNRPENLEVVSDIAHHWYLHRSRENDLRLPGQQNEVVECACGCGRTFLKYDEAGRPRTFMSGHNPMPSPTKDLIIHALVDGPKNLRYLANLHGNLRAIKVSCSKLVRQGHIVRVGRGIYGISN